MPRVRRRGVPPALFQHLLDRIAERKIGSEQLELMAAWLDSEPEVPEGAWYRRFPGMIVCGEGELVKTFLIPGQIPVGKRVV
jgi:ribosomal protein S18 acetylase RimI-like enzyme